MHAELSAVFVLCLLLLSCGEATPISTTWVDVRFYAEEASLARATSLSLIVFDTEGGIALGESIALTGPDQTPLPAGARLLPEGGDAQRRYRILAELIDDTSGPFSRIRATGTYIEGTGARLDLYFGDACQGVLCADGQTCADGACMGACFEPRAETTEGRDGPVHCPGAQPVWVDGASGTDHPRRCTDPMTPCASVQYALDTYPLPGLGTEINVRGGITYTENVVLREHVSGGDGITQLRAWPDTGRPVIDAAGADVGISVCCGETAPGRLRIEGFEVTGATGHGVLISGRGAEDVTLADNLVRENGRGPSPGNEGSGITVEDGATAIALDGNEVRDSISMTAGQPTRGIVMRDIVDATIIDNLVVGSSANGIRVAGGARVLVRGNTVRDGGTNGMTFWGEDHQATYNVLCSNGAVGIRVLEATNLVIEHNSFTHHGTNGVELAGPSSGTLLRSNAVVSSSGPAVTSVTEDPMTSHNMFVANSGAYAGAAHGDPTDVGGTDPLFTDRQNCDLSLQPGSPAIGTAHDGANVGAL